MASVVRDRAQPSSGKLLNSSDAVYDLTAFYEALAALTQHIVVDLAAGTNAIGKLAANSGVDIGDVDVLSIAAGTNAIGKLAANDGVDIGDVGLDAGEAHIGSIGGNTVTVAQTPAVTAGIYTAKDAVGGLLTFASAARVSGGAVTIQSVVVTDLGAQSGTLMLALFDRTFTAIADNAAFAPSDADLANCIGVIPIYSTDYQAFSDNAVATVRNIGLGVVLSGTSLFGQLMCTGTPTYASTSDLTLKLTLYQE